MLKLDGIVKYMRSKAGPSSKELKSVEDAEKFLDNTEHSIVGKCKYMEDVAYSAIDEGCSNSTRETLQAKMFIFCLLHNLDSTLTSLQY